MSKLAGLLLACIVIVLGGCASTPNSGHAQWAVPPPVSELYSQANLQFLLVTVPDEQGGCAESECLKRAEFDKRVARTGAMLAGAAFEAYPGLAERIARFDFSVADKAEPGTASTAAGRVVVLRPVSSLAPAEEALGFIIGREIGHVVAQHHEENTAVNLIISAVATVIAPIAGVAKLLALIFSGTTSAAASASVSAASFAGSRAVIESYRPRQRDEADRIAMNLLAPLGYDARAVAAGFAQTDLQTPPTKWMLDLRASVDRVAALADRQIESATGLVFGERLQ